MNDPWDTTAETPPDDFTDPQKALWWLRKGDFAVGPAWEQAHEIAQGGEGDPDHDLVHALLHWIEGDRFNSDYWYRRAGSPRTSTDAEAEWSALRARIAS